MIIRYSVSVNIVRFHRTAPGSIPGTGDTLSIMFFLQFNLIIVAGFAFSLVRLEPRPLSDSLEAFHRCDGNNSRHSVAGGTNEEVHPCCAHKLGVAGSMLLVTTTSECKGDDYRTAIKATKRRDGAEKQPHSDVTDSETFTIHSDHRIRSLVCLLHASIQAIAQPHNPFHLNPFLPETCPVTTVGGLGQ